MELATSFETEIPIEAILARVAEHMTHLAETLASTESAVSDHFQEALAQDVDAFQDVQNLDYLHQSMTDTAALLTSLSSGCRTQITLIEKLKLETTRALVLGAPFNNDFSESGVIDLF